MASWVCLAFSNLRNWRLEIDLHLSSQNNSIISISEIPFRISSVIFKQENSSSNSLRNLLNLFSSVMGALNIQLLKLVIISFIINK